MKDPISRLSQAGTLHSLSVQPEDRTTQWWQVCAQAFTIKTETGQWPSTKHPTCGRWMKQTCDALKVIKNRGHVSESGNRVLSGERLSELRRIGFPMDGTVPINTLERDGPLERIMQAIANGQKPKRADRDVISRRKLDMETYEYLVSHGVKL